MWRRRYLIGCMGLVVVLLGLGIALRARAALGRAPQVQEAKVTRDTIKRTVSADGVLMPLATLDVKSRAAGRVDKLLVEEGDIVKAGQLIAEIDPRDMAAAMTQASADLASARARKDQADKNLTIQTQTSKSQLEQAQQSVEDALTRLRRTEQAGELQSSDTANSMEQARQALAIAGTRLEQAQLDRRLREEQTATQEQEAEASLESAKARLLQAEQRAATQPQLTEASLAQAEAGYQSAQAKLDALTRASQPLAVAQAQASYDQAKTNLDRAEKDYQRQKALHEQGFVSTSQLDSSSAAYENAKSDLQSAAERLRTLKEQNEADKESAKAALAQSKASLDSAKASASQDEVVAQQDLEAARAAVRQAQAGLASAKAGRLQVDTADKDVAASEASLRQAQESLKAALAGETRNSMAKQDIVSAQIAVAQAQSSLSQARANALQTDVRRKDVTAAQASVTRSEATARNAAQQFADTTIVAPRSGVVLTKYVEEGTMITSGMSAVTQGTNIVQLGDLSRMFVQVQVDETDIPQVRLAQAVDIKVDALPDETFKGTVTLVAPQAVKEQNVTSVKVKVEVENPGSKLRPGMNATCDFVIMRKENVLTVPSEAVVDKAGETFVYQWDPKKSGRDKRVKRTVVIGAQDDTKTEIVSGLAEGDSVLQKYTDPLEELKRQPQGGLFGPPPRRPSSQQRGGGTKTSPPPPMIRMR